MNRQKINKHDRFHFALGFIRCLLVLKSRHSILVPRARMRATVLLMLVAVVAGDIYLQGPRGSNNRLNEANRARNNGNRYDLV